MELSELGFENKWVAFFDILGFSDLVKQAESPMDHCRIIDLYEEALSLIEEKCSFYRDNISYTWFSDSFIVFTKDDSVEGYICIQQLSKQFVTRCLYKRIPLRGAITCSPFLANEDKRIYVGKALVDAYKTAECQNWVGLLMTQRAIEKAHVYGLEPLHHDFVDTDIPVKKGRGLLKRNCLAYSFSNGAANFSHPVLPILSELKIKAPDYAKEKYDNTIKHIKLFYKFI